MKNKLIQSSLKQIKESSAELEYFSSNYLEEINIWKQRFDSSTIFHRQIYTMAMKRYKLLIEELNEYKEQLSRFQTALISSQENSSENDLIRLIKTKNILFLSARSIISSYTSLVTFLNWQSPSLKSSMNSRVGIEKYAVSWDFNDYKRDRSNDTIYLEKQLGKKLLVTKGTGRKPVLRLFNCGMAAFTSIMYAMIGEKIVNKKILLSSDIYVEALLLLNKFFSDKLHIIKTNETNSIIDEILKTKPNVVFLEPLSNTAEMPLFDVKTIVKEVSKKYRDIIYFVIDVTCFIGFENIFDNFKIPDNIKIILHGSILKSPQLGMERVNSGFVMSFGLEHFKNDILDYRTFSGTNMQDICANLFPVFPRRIVKKRQLIIQKNTIEIAQYLKSLDNDHKIFDSVVYPGLKEHKDYHKAINMGFAGPFFNIKFLSKCMTDKHFEYFTYSFVKYAKELEADVVHGASYGFNQTSIYYALGWEGFGDHYIRISVGTETPYEIEKIKLVLTKVVEDFKSKFKLS